MFQNILAFTNSSVPGAWTLPLADEISFSNNYSPDNSKGYSFCKVSQLESWKSNGRNTYENYSVGGRHKAISSGIIGPIDMVSVILDNPLHK